MTDYFHRDLAPTVFSALEEMPVVVIIGLRQTELSEGGSAIAYGESQVLIKPAVA